ncbi:MAG: phage head-tail connector protein [Advenella sp.]
MLNMFGSQTENGRTYQRTDPGLPGASVEELRELLRLEDDSGEYTVDTYLDGLLLTATEYASRYLNRSLITTEWTRQFDLAMQTGLHLEYKRERGLYLPFGPVDSVDRVYWISTDGTENTIESTAYYIDLLGDPARVYLRQWVAGREIAMLRIEYTAGYGESYAEVPRLIQQGILQHAAYLYEHRGDCGADEAAKLSGAHSVYGSYRVSPI